MKRCGVSKNFNKEESFRKFKNGGIESNFVLCYTVKESPCLLVKYALFVLAHIMMVRELGNLAENGGENYERTSICKSSIDRLNDFTHFRHSE